MDNKFTQMTDDQLKNAHKDIQDTIYDHVNSVELYATRGMIETEDAIEAEMKKRGINLRWDTSWQTWVFVTTHEPA